MIFSSQKRELFSFNKIIERSRKAFRYKWNRIDIAFLWFNIFTLIFRMLCLYICIQQWWLWNLSIWVIVLIHAYTGRFTSLLYDVEWVFRSLNQIIWESTAPRQDRRIPIPAKAAVIPVKVARVRSPVATSLRPMWLIPRRRHIYFFITFNILLEIFFFTIFRKI